MGKEKKSQNKPKSTPKKETTNTAFSKWGRLLSNYSNLITVVIIFLFTLIYTGEYLSQYIKSDIIPGWDGVQHYAVNKAYSENVYPKTQGVLNNWYAGLPWPTFYPPLFTYTMALLDHVLPFSYFLIFKYMFVILVFLFPLLIFWITTKLDYSPLERLLAGIFGILFLISSGDQAGTLGIAMGGTFENGLYPQFFACIVMLFWFGSFLTWILKFEDNRWFDFKGGFSFIKSPKNFRVNKISLKKFLSLGLPTYLFSSVLFGLVLISNVHIAQPALITFAIFSVFYYLRYKSKSYIWYFVHFLVAFFIALIWYLPLFKYRNYFLTQTITEVPFHIALLTLLAPLMFALFGVSSIKSKKHSFRIYLFFSALAILVVTVIPWARIWGGLPLQPFRVFPVAYMYLMVLAPLGVMRFQRWLKLDGSWKLVGILLVLSPVLYWYPPVDRSISGIYTLSSTDRELIEFLKNKTDGRSIFEVWLDDAATPYLPKAKQPTHFILSALVIENSKHQTLWSAFRESSILSPFVQPLRNSFSFRHESFGVVCYLCVDTNGRPGFNADEFYQQPWQQHLQRAKLMGVKYIAVRNDSRKTIYSQNLNDSMTLIATFGNWQVFEVIGSDLAPIRLNLEPILTFTQLNTRARPAQGADAYDWLRLNEEWFFHGNFEHVFARSEAKYIDEIDELDEFKYLLLTRFDYIDKKKAYNMLVEFGQNNHVIIVSSNEPFYDELVFSNEIPNNNLHIIEKTGNVRDDVKEILSLLDKINLPIEDNIDNSLSDAWLLHKTTFFPSIQSNYEDKIYLASPAFTLEHKAVNIKTNN